MRVDSSSQSILKTGSFTGFRSLEELGHGYLTATRTIQQPLCGNEEGWGPLSPHRYDFTPCFMDVWVSSVAVYGILFGAVAVWWLVRRKQKAEVQKDWHFWTKQVGRKALVPYSGPFARCEEAYAALIGTHCGDSNNERYTTGFPNYQLSRCLDRRLSILDERSYTCFVGCYFHHPMA